MIEPNDLKRLCSSLSRFSSVSGWCWKGIPVVVYEFAAMDDFYDAYAQLYQAITPDLGPNNREALRKLSSEVVELDCYGVTFRMICKERRMTHNGPMGISDLLDLNMQIRKKQ